jgi:hypothetical protein
VQEIKFYAERLPAGETLSRSITLPLPIPEYGKRDEADPAAPHEVVNPPREDVRGRFNLAERDAGAIAAISGLRRPAPGFDVCSSWRAATPRFASVFFESSTRSRRLISRGAGSAKTASGGGSTEQRRDLPRPQQPRSGSHQISSDCVKLCLRMLLSR